LQIANIAVSVSSVLGMSSFCIFTVINPNQAYLHLHMSIIHRLPTIHPVMKRADPSALHSAPPSPTARMLAGQSTSCWLAATRGRSCKTAYIRSGAAQPRRCCITCRQQRLAS
jgi:hypothetical protein